MKPVILQNKGQIEKHSDIVTHAMEQYREDGIPQNAWDFLDPERNMCQAEDARNRDSNENKDSEDHHRVQVHTSISLSTTIRPREVSDYQLQEIL